MKNPLFPSAVFVLTLIRSASVWGGVFTPYVGEWQVELVNLPTYVADGVASEAFELGSSPLTFSDDGTFTIFDGDVLREGVMFVSGTNPQTLGFRIEEEDATPTPGYPNNTRSALMIAEEEDDRVSFGLAVRSPDSLALPELAGSWTASTLTFPTSVDGSAFNAQFQSETSSATFTSDGNVTIEGGGSGTLSVEDATGFRFFAGESESAYFINDDKDLAIRSEANDVELRFQVLSKAPETLTLAELEGDWQILTFSAENQSSPSGNLNTDDYLEFSSNLLQITDDGFINAEGGATLEVNPDLSVKVTSDEVVFDLHLNASKNVMVAALPSDPGTAFFLLGMKLSNATVETTRTLDIGLDESGEVKISWEPAPDLELFRSEDLQFWRREPITPTQSSITLPTDADAQFYRTVTVD